MTSAPDLSDLIREGRAGRLSQPDFARAFAETRILVLLATPAEGDSVQPLVLELPNGEPAVAAFSGPGAVVDDYLQAAPHPIAMTGRELLEMLPEGVGLALNPGQEHSLPIEPDEVRLFGFVALSPASAPDDAAGAPAEPAGGPEDTAHGDAAAPEGAPSREQ
ncbi:SseB family protein [Falsarthrobacter nasiphocae]|uniref:SseB protein N-terminal domain-containing protein n=1 Tax=Falsarthrobacter nasiphocae TaxID=189863 RepID=A0AAE3YHZ4_9MICC|nr:SseB family protein [Falsarthrobacter nasiphocae]MDR6892273.1 hypothetical protein [Falsarthrobacter nasiphocae]